MRSVNSNGLETKIPTSWMGNDDIFETVLGFNSVAISYFSDYQDGVFNIFQNTVAKPIDLFEGGMDVCHAVT